jgi:hypothetical protein
MSPATKELFSKLRMIVPPMLEKFHKGVPLQLTRFQLKKSKAWAPS